ncbi:MAG TPA: sugar ABC transporter substrate-binding protein [Acetobacteraceae bacterium]|jgi:multiple sugar transport system substrate-binding protein|nr:sugar ABC transporter substrate-binding protein [Acetobacteraceae bacterium]
MHRRSLLALLAGAAVPLRAYAAPPASTTATLTLFRPASDSDIRLTNAAVERFNKRYPSVTVKAQYVSTNPWGDYITQFLNQVSSSTPPDLVMMATEGVSTLGSRNLVRDVMPYVQADPVGKALFDDIEPALLSGLRYRDKLAYVPNEWNTVVTYYNTAMFSEAGAKPPAPDWTWADFLDAAQKLTKRDASGKVTQYGYFIPGGQFALSTWFLTNNTDRLSEDGHASNVRDPKFREALVFLHDLIHKHRVSPAFARNDTGGAPFLAKQVAMFAGTHPRVTEMISAKFDTVDVQLCPRNRSQTSIAGMGGIGITAASPNPDLAWELLKELTGQANAEQLSRDMRSIPPTRAAATNAQFLSFPPNAKIFYGAAAVAKPLAQPPNFAQVEDIMMRNVDAYLTGNQEIDPMLDALDGELSRAMARVKW